MNRPACCNEQAATDRLAMFHRPSWREALSGLAAPAVRLHRWREARARMFEQLVDERERE